MQLTDNQNIATLNIKSFLESDEKEIFILKGYAGTGKTFLIREIVKYLGSNSRQYYLAAPTGRAARMLKERTEQDASTIHSLIYSLRNAQLGDEEECDEVIWNFDISNNTDDISAVYLIDEASMVSDTKGSDEEFVRFGSGKVLEDLFNYVGYTSKVKIPSLKRKLIFIGDTAQLPPIESNISQALSVEHLAEKYKLRCEEFTLTEVLRQGEKSGILETATNIRESIEKKEFNHFLIKQMKDVRDVSNSLYNNWMNDKSEKIVITNSNKKALDYNIALRGKRYNEKDIIAGDRLIVVANNYRHHLLNGDFVDIVEISGESEKHSIKLRGREEATVLSFRKLKVAVTSSEKVVSIMDVMILENLIWSPERSLSRDELVAIRVLAAQKANTKFPSKWLLKNDLKKYILQKEKYIKEMKENEYYNALQVKFGYAITCHKAQGGEWDNVYVDFSSNGSINNQKYFRWSYTAITRAKRELLYLNAPSISSWSNLITGSVTNNSADFDMEENTSFNVDVPESINSGLPKNLYLVVSKNILDSTFLIESVKPLNWRERYQFTSGDDYCTVDFLYNKKGNLIKNIIDSSSKKVSDNLLELLANVKVVSTIQESIDYNFPKPFLKEFHNIIENGFKQTGIKISKLKHNNYAENYQFSSLTEFCDLIFYYNDKDMFSKSSPILNNCSNKSFADKCISQINFYLAND